MKSFLVWCASIAIVALMIVVATPKATTTFAAAGNLTGAAWSSNIGWISLGNGGATYGVSMAPTGTTRNLSGYAWSSNIGWVSFNPNDFADRDSGGNQKCPFGTCQPRVEWGTTGGPSVLVKGWARACSVFATGCSGALKLDVGVRGGWDGFISLGDSKPTDAVNYGIRINTTTGDALGYAWGSEVVGWVDFAGVKVDITGNPVICSDGITTVPPATSCPTTCPDNTPIPSSGRCSTGPTTCADGISTPPACNDCPVGSTCYCAANQTDFINCLNNCSAAESSVEGSTCWCAKPANSTSPKCQVAGGICANIPDATEQSLIAEGLLTNPVTPPYRKTTDNKCLCVSGYILNPVTFKCTKPVYTEH